MVALAAGQVRHCRAALPLRATAGPWHRAASMRSPLDSFCPACGSYAHRRNECPHVPYHGKERASGAEGAPDATVENDNNE